MFGEFSKAFYARLLSIEYQLVYGDADFFQGTSLWAVQKVELSTFVNLNICNGTGKSWDDVLAIDARVRPQAEALLDRVGQVANIYLIIGGGLPSFDGAEEYTGSSSFSVFWHLDLFTGKITAPKGQPSKLFGLNELIASAWLEMGKAISGGGAYGSEAYGSDSFAAVEKKAIQLAPSPKYTHAYVVYGILIVNAIVLGLMYLDGFPNDMLAPMRFGAIVPELVHYRGEWYRLFTAMFVHFGITHFAANAFGLIIFGTRVERYFGRICFILVYITAGLAGSLASLYLSRAYAAGASGAIYGLVGALFIYTKIHKRTIERLNWYVMFLYIGIGLAMGFATPGIDNFAHLGGLAGGVLVGGIYAYLKKGVLSRNAI